MLRMVDILTGNQPLPAGHKKAQRRRSISLQRPTGTRGSDSESRKTVLKLLGRRPGLTVPEMALDTGWPSNRLQNLLSRMRTAGQVHARKGSRNQTLNYWFRGPATEPDR